MVTRLNSVGGTRAVGIAVGTILGTGLLVPAGALRHLLGGLALLGVGGKHLALAAPELVGLLVVVADKVGAAVGRVGVDGVGLQWKLMRCSHCQELCQLAVLASNCLFTLV